MERALVFGSSIQFSQPGDALTDAEERVFHPGSIISIAPISSFFEGKIESVGDQEMTFYILRHGDKEKGEFRKPDLPLNDQPLSEFGQGQARKLVGFFKDREIAHIYVSAYQRTSQTIAYVAEDHGLKPVMDERLNEINIGAFENITLKELEEKFPMELKAFRERSRDFQFPDGESGEEGQKRIVEFLDEKRKLHGDENVIAACHDGLMRTLLCHVLGIPVYKRWGFSVETCGIIELEFEADYGTWKLIRYNQTCSDRLK